jgi:hypothetical protein
MNAITTTTYSTQTINNMYGIDEQEHYYTADESVDDELDDKYVICDGVTLSKPHKGKYLKGYAVRVGGRRITKKFDSLEEAVIFAKKEQIPYGGITFGKYKKHKKTNTYVYTLRKENVPTIPTKNACWEDESSWVLE